MCICNMKIIYFHKRNRYISKLVTRHWIVAEISVRKMKIMWNWVSMATFTPQPKLMEIYSVAWRCRHYVSQNTEQVEHIMLNLCKRLQIELRSRAENFECRMRNLKLSVILHKVLSPRFRHAVEDVGFNSFDPITSAKTFRRNCQSHCC